MFIVQKPIRNPETHEIEYKTLAGFNTYPEAIFFKGNREDMTGEHYIIYDEQQSTATHDRIQLTSQQIKRVMWSARNTKWLDCLLENLINRTLDGKFSNDALIEIMDFYDDIQRENLSDMSTEEVYKYIRGEHK